MYESDVFCNLWLVLINGYIVKKIKLRYVKRQFWIIYDFLIYFILAYYK